MPTGNPRRAPRRPARILFAHVLLAAALLAAPGRSHAQGAAGAPVDTLVVLSTGDVKGKTLPCGCHTPKGGLARRGGFTDSLRAQHPDLLVVDAGGFFPDGLNERDDAPFVTQAMRDLGVNVAAVGDRELMYGRAYFLATVAAAQLPVVSANLLDKATGRPLVQPWRVEKAGRVKVGVFGLTSDKAPLGPSADSLAVSDPVAAAKQAVAELRKQGATVVVLLSALGKVETEDLVVSVPGIDVAVASRNVPLLQRNRVINDTAVLYGGVESHYMGLAEIAVDAKGRAVSTRGEMVMLGPEVSDRPAMRDRVTEWEARPDVKARRKPVAQPARADTSQTSAR